MLPNYDYFLTFGIVEIDLTQNELRLTLIQSNLVHVVVVLNIDVVGHVVDPTNLPLKFC